MLNGLESLGIRFVCMNWVNDGDDSGGGSLLVSFSCILLEAMMNTQEYIPSCLEK